MDPTSVLHDMRRAVCVFAELILRRRDMAVSPPNGTGHESVLKYEVYRPRKSSYLRTSNVPAEVLERRRLGHELYHLVVLEGSHEDG